MAMAVVIIARVRRRILCPTMTVAWESPARLARARSLALALALTLALTLALSMAWLSWIVV